MKALVTGSHGFLGSHLVSRLEQMGWEVLKGDREGTVPKVDYVFDCAAYGNLYTHEDIDRILEANYYRVKRLLDNCKKVKPKSIVLTSSSSVSLPVQTVYSASKVLMEELAQQYDLPIVIVRPHKPYGIGDDPAHLIPKIFGSCLKGEILEIDPAPVHDYVYIEDYINILIVLAKNVKQDIVEIGTGKPTSNIEILARIERITGYKANYILSDKSRNYDSLDWYYKGDSLYLPTDLDTGLKKIYEYYKQGLKEKNNYN